MLTALLLVGSLSGTLVRHVIQVMPIALALLVISRGSRWSGFCAGVQTFFTGTFSPAEALLTVVIGALSLVGVVISFRTSRVKTLRALGVVAVFGAIQLAAMWVSFLPPFADR